MAPAVLPVVLGFVVGIVLHKTACGPTFATPSEAAQFGGTVASMGVTMLGFMLASLAVIASINHTQLVAMMRKTGHYHNLLSTLFTGCAFFLFCALMGYAFLFGLPATPILVSAAIGLHVSALVSLLDVGRKFWLVLRNLTT